MELISKESVGAVWRRSARMLLGRHHVPLERWVRLQFKRRRLARADVVVVSFAKSGRTWLRVMMSRLYQTKYGLPDQMIIERDNLHKVDPAIPIFLFGHGIYSHDAGSLVGEASPYYRKRLIFLARHPADIAVSYYFHLRNRANPLLQEVRGHPKDLSDTPMLEFLASSEWGLPAIIRYLNNWADMLSQHPTHLLVCYEDLHQDPKPQLMRIAEFVGERFDDDAFDEAIKFASFDRLQQKERENFFANRRLQPRDPSNLESFKVRRGKVRGYRDYFNDREVAWIEQQIAEQLNPMYGYADSTSAGYNRQSYRTVTRHSEA